MNFLHRRLGRGTLVLVLPLVGCSRGHSGDLSRAPTGSPRQALAYQYSLGERLHYQLKYESQGSFDLTKLLRSAAGDSSDTASATPLLSRTFSTGVQGEITATTVAHSADTTIVAYELVPRELSFSMDRDSAAIDRAALARELGELLFATVDASGRVISVRFDPSISGTAQSYLRSILALAQFVTPSRDTSPMRIWTAQESDPSGRYLAEYRLDAGPSAKAAALSGVWSITKTKVQYLTSDSASVGSTGPLVRASGSLSALFDGRHGLLRSLSGRETQQTSISNRTVGTASSAIDLSLERADTLDGTPLDSLRRLAMARLREWRAVSLTTQASPGEAEHRIEQAALGRTAFDSLLGALAAADTSDSSAAGTTPLYLKVKAFSYLHPEAMDTITSLLVRGRPHSVSMRLLASALAAAGTEQSQAALAAALQERLRDRDAVLVLGSALTSVETPTSAAVRALQNAADAGDERAYSLIVLALGADANRLRRPNPALADSIATWLSRRLSGATESSRRTVLLEALGNVGGSSLGSVVARYLNDSAVDVRVAAVATLAQVDASRAEPLLIRALTSDADARVRAAAAAALGEHPTTTAADAEVRVFPRERSANVRLALVDALWAARRLSPAAERLVRSAAAMDASEEVRARAARLLGAAQPQGSTQPR
jgi:HEAT repeat protein